MATAMQKHTITAFYESRHLADAAANKLRQFGVPASEVAASPTDARDGHGLYGDAPTSVAAPRKPGFWTMSTGTCTWRRPRPR